MSIRLMSAVWELDLTPVEKLVFLALADCANDEGLAWPSIATIQRKANVGERTVQRSIRTLEAMGLLTRQEVIGKGCKYTLNPRHAGTPATKAPVPQSAQTPATLAPKPSRNTNNKKKPERPMPDGWVPSAFGKGSESRRIVDGWPPDELKKRLEAFEAHHRAKGSMFSDWQAAWSTWVLNSKTFGARQNGKPPPGNDEPQNPYVRAVLKRQADRAGVGF